MGRQINAAGLALVKSFETCRLVAFLPTPNDVPTIAWGHTKGVNLGDTCTQDQADEWLVEDLSWAEQTVDTHATISLTDNQFSAPDRDDVAALLAEKGLDKRPDGK